MSAAVQKSPHSRAEPIDPRGPRFGAAVTTVLLLITLIAGLSGLSTATRPAAESAGAEFALRSAPLADRILDPAFVLLLLATVLFAIGAFAGIGRHPYGWLFRTLIRPRLGPTGEREDPRPPTFAQGVGFLIGTLGLVLHLTGVPYGLVVAVAAALVAAFLNAAFGFCLGCQLYLGLVRLGLVGRTAVPSRRT